MTNKSVTPNKFLMVGIKAYTVNSLVSGEGILPSIRLMGMSRCMESHFHDCIDYNGVAFSMGSHIFKNGMGSHIFKILEVKKSW